MITVNLTQAKARLSELIARAEAGEDIVVTRHGRPVVQISSVDPPKQPVRPLADVRARLPRLSAPSAELLRRLRHDER